MGAEGLVEVAIPDLATVTTDKAGRQVDVRVDLIRRGAKAHLESGEVGKQSFEQVKEKTRAVWNKVLEQAAVSGGTEKQKTIFYTALYHALGRMSDITEDGQYYSGCCKVHDAEGHDFYVDDGCGTHATLTSLRLPHKILVQQQDMVRSFSADVAEQVDGAPSFPG